MPHTVLADPNAFLPALLLAVTVLTALVLLLTGLHRVLHATGWSRQQQQRIFLSVMLGLSGWIALLCILSIRGFFTDFSRLPPRIGIAVLLPLPFILVLFNTRGGRLLLQKVPQAWPVWYQSFRIPVELFLWMAVVRGLLPVQMSFEGLNWDILTGLSSLPVAWYCFVKKTWPARIALYFNILGLLLLLNIIVISMLSMPAPMRQFHNDPSAMLLADFPFVLLPGFLVPLAYTFHIMSIFMVTRPRQ